ncbi:MAG: cytidylyltransferase domain-containing protein [Anaerolineales bacterium]
MVTEVLAIIPARGGSKSIPRKNIRLFAGHPLIAYSIAASLASKTISRTIVSTDDSEIADISQKYGAQVPFMRPAELARDGTPDLPVYAHALQWLEDNENYQPDIFVQLRPTSPFRRVSHIDEAVERLIKRPDADAIRTVCIPFQNPFKMWYIKPDGFMQPIIESGFSESYNLPRQALPEVFWQTGYVDAAWSKTVTTKDSMTGDRILPLIIDPGEWIDIDSPDDWQRAERLIDSGEITLKDLGFRIN